MNKIINAFNDSVTLRKNILKDHELLKKIDTIIEIILDALKRNKSIFTCGNGGSASDAIHFVAEFVGRFQMNSRPYRAFSLNSDIATITAIGNDFGYDMIFSRQVESNMVEGDVLICFSSSGKSKNILNAINQAKKNKALTISFLGKDGGQALKDSDINFLVPSRKTSRIREIHTTLTHIICERVEEELK